MPSSRNIQLVKETNDRVQKAAALFFVDYQGLTHKQLEELRSLLRKTNSEISIVKNTLMNLALSVKKIDAKERLHGPLAVLFSYNDSLAVAKVLYTFFRKYNLPKIKFGVFEEKVIEEKEVIQLALLPSKEVLLGKFVGLLKSPMSNLVYGLNWNVQKFVLVLDNIKNRKANIKNTN